jgi:hypothetical protein
VVSAFTPNLATALGENTEQILIDLLGYTWDDIAAMRDEGAIL